MSGAAYLHSDNRSDLELAARIVRRDVGAVRLVMQRNDQRLFHVAWRILKNHQDAEDSVQSAYLKAFAAIKDFGGRSSLSTWLTRIVINDALAHARSAKRRRSWLEENEVPILDHYREMLMCGSMSESPERAVARAQIREMLDEAIDRLPPPFRAVFVLREINELNVSEVAERLGIPVGTVKSRYLRARQRLRTLLRSRLDGPLSGYFPFNGASPERTASPPRCLAVDATHRGIPA